MDGQDLQDRETTGLALQALNYNEPPRHQVTKNW